MRQIRRSCVSRNHFHFHHATFYSGSEVLNALCSYKGGHASKGIIEKIDNIDFEGIKVDFGSFPGQRKINF